MRYKKAAFAFSMLYAVCLLGIAGYWNKTKPVDAAVEVSEKPKIAITFDDGPSVYTEELLDGLKDRGVKAVSYTHLTRPTTRHQCRSRWSPYH